MICTVQECKIKTPWGKLCTSHYYRYKVHGSPTARMRQDPNQIWDDGKIGYVELYNIDNSVKSIAIIDAEDIDKVKKLKWCENGSGYAQATHKNRGKVVLMHRFIKPYKVELDHKNRDKLDNRKSNLRVATRMENGRNRKSSGIYKGVYKSGNNWIVRVWFNGDNVNIGSFADSTLAAHIYNDVATQLLGNKSRFIKKNDV